MNVSGTSNVLDAVRTFDHPCVVIVITTDKCYAEPAVNGGCRESDPMGGDDPYSASKAAAEIISASYRKAISHPQRYLSMAFSWRRYERAMLWEVAIGRPIGS